MKKNQNDIFEEELNTFAPYHINATEDNTKGMLDFLQEKSLEHLIKKVIPQHIITKKNKLSDGFSEETVLENFHKFAKENKQYHSMMGQGFYDTIMPSVIRKNILENPSWYSAYTPYQAEISQGRLEILFTFQHMICDLTSMDVAGASLLDEASAAAESMTMAKRVTNDKRNLVIIDRNCHPQNIAVVKTRAYGLGIDVAVGEPEKLIKEHKNNFFVVITQYPGTNGEIPIHIEKLIQDVHDQKALIAVSADLMALTLLKPPGEMGADIVFGTTQRFGVPLGYGGPHAAYFACKDQYKRQMPGRIIGLTKDKDGRPALRTALQTREQHIRRDKATSNICTAQTLPAILATLYAMHHGPDGLKRIATRIHNLAKFLAVSIDDQKHIRVTQNFFDTITLIQYGTLIKIDPKLHRVNLFEVYPGEKKATLAINEKTSIKNVVSFLAVMTNSEAVPMVPNKINLDEIANSNIEAFPKKLKRTSPFLTHPIFHKYQNEQEMTRYLHRLASKDIALNHSMIPLGSCTMKLNSAVELATWPNDFFANVHPMSPIFAPQRKTNNGYSRILSALDRLLCSLTGYDHFYLAPNSGAQGEYAGLMTIRAYHESRGEPERTICLIPASAHGTNPASAVLAGMNVVQVKCDKNGNVDVADLKEKAEEHSKTLAALMITYPSTHGVFETAIRDICAIIHEHGGQVYFDGANYNAMVGHVNVAELGADVGHLNLHKTFCIPHGGGGPGVGPIGVRRHLINHLPKHHSAYMHENTEMLYDNLFISDNFKEKDKTKLHFMQITSSYYGSASLLTIPWAYIALMGEKGMQKATSHAILNANYIAARLKSYFPILYTGENGYVAHECIIDLRPIKDETGVTATDIAKRLIDYGFHAPTVSFPVSGTMMIEPTESESKEELDRFCDAMISIYQEIQEIKNGKADKENNLLKNAPHTADLLTNETWDFPYSKERTFFPLPWVRERKYWPPISRIDEVYGDRNLTVKWSDESHDHRI